MVSVHKAPGSGTFTDQRYRSTNMLRLDAANSPAGGKVPSRLLNILRGVLGGALTLSVIATLQNLSIHAPLTPAGYLIPAAFGGAIGAFVYSLWTNPQQRLRKQAGVEPDCPDSTLAKQALRDSERKLHAILDHHFQLTGLIDTEGSVVEVNETALRLAGVDKSTVLGQYFWDGPWWQEAQRSSIKDAIKRALLGEFIHFETTHLAANGELRNIDFSLNPVKDESGKVLWIVPEGRDITAFQRAEKTRDNLARQLREQSKQLERILDTVPEGVLLLDVNRRVLNANPRAISDLNVLADAKVGDVLVSLGDRTIDDLLAPSPTRGLWHEVKHNGRIFEVIARPMQSPNALTGEEAQASDAASMPNHWVMVINDVSKVREVKYRIQQQERMAALGQLASGIAHDFNNIIAVIVLYAQLGSHDPKATKKLRERFDTISHQAKQATDLIQQILDFSRSSVLEMQPIDLSPYLNEFVKLLRRLVPEHIDISFERSPGECLVLTDPTRLQQALMNLVVNARDAMPQGGRLNISLSRQRVIDEIECETCGQMITGEWLHIKVSDNGTGIPDDVLPHIFEPFYTTKGPGKGTGLGLPQVQGIVAQLNGHLSLQTQVNHGISFTIYLPLLDTQVRTYDALVLDEPVYGSGETILLVEDNAPLQRALADNLDELGYQISTAPNGQHALDILMRRGKEIDLVLCDYVMPGMGGRMLFQAMQEQGLDIPVIILSGHPLDNELEELRNQGLSGWMSKPPDMVKLSQMIAGVVAKHAIPETH